MNKILIFGIGGFVGSYLTKEFIDHGYKVFGSDVISSEGFDLDNSFYKADLLQYDEIYQLIFTIKPDVIVNLAAISSVGESWNMPQNTMSVNVIGALNIMEAVRQCCPETKILLIGSSEEYESTDEPVTEQMLLNANNPYGISKIAQEQFAQMYRERYGMKIYYVRAFNHTGIGQKETFVLPGFCQQAAKIERSEAESVIRVGNLSAERDFSNVKDIVRAYRMIVESDECNRIYNVGSGKAYALRELLEYVISLGTKEITIQTDEERFRPVDNPRICCDYSLIRENLGWYPQYDIFETVKEMYDYYLSK